MSPSIHSIILIGIAMLYVAWMLGCPLWLILAARRAERNAQMESDEELPDRADTVIREYEEAYWDANGHACQLTYAGGWYTLVTRAHRPIRVQEATVRKWTHNLRTRLQEERHEET